MESIFAQDGKRLELVDFDNQVPPGFRDSECLVGEDKGCRRCISSRRMETYAPVLTLHCYHADEREMNLRAILEKDLNNFAVYADLKEEW